jgi:AcrR family transcriptional regulator/DNA-binding MarR family transcriptional regulator
MQLFEVQRARMLSSAVAVVSRYGYGEMTVARVAGGARVSRRTFYDAFADREDCFLAVFDEAVARAWELGVGAYMGEDGWLRQVRAALGALLGFLDEEPGVGVLLVVDALKAGPRVQERRAEVLEELAGTLQRGGVNAGSGRELSPLTGEGVLGAVLGVIHTRVLARRPDRMGDLLNPLMGMVVLPYLGPAAAQKELERSVSAPAHINNARTGVRGSSSLSPTSSVKDPLEGLPMRLTYRTLRVLTAIGELPGASNREVADHAEVSDQGQISKLLSRLQRLGLIENAGEGQSNGEPNAWRLTSRGEAVHRAIPARPDRDELQANGKRERPRR